MPNANVSGVSTDGVADEPTEVALSLTSVPVQSWDVRRRQYNGQHWLVRHNETFELNDLTDAVWRACTDHVSVAAVARIVADELGEPPVSLLEPTLAALHLLGGAGLVRFEPGP